MKAGIYSVSFSSNVGMSGGGLAFFENGRIHGGDDKYLYLGTYHVTDTAVTAELTVRHYRGPKQSIFGNVGEFKVSLGGQVSGDSFKADGHVSGQPALTMNVQGKLIVGAVGA